MDFKMKQLTQTSAHVLLLLLVFFICFISFGDTLENTLSCYQCTIHGKNESTCDNELRRCPNDQAYDRCKINVLKNQTTGDFIIIKRCALAPCEFEKSVEKTLGFLDKCILSRPDPDCVQCCTGDGCNKRATENLGTQLATNPANPRKMSIIPMLLILVGSIFGRNIAASLEGF